MFDLEALVRPNIQKLKPYHSARDDFDDGLLLDANENSLGAPSDILEGLHRYPSPSQDTLRSTIARFRDVEKEQVFIGNGSDEAIDLLFRILCTPGEDRVITTPPTYGMYRVSAGIHNIGITEVPLDDHFQPRVDAILEEASPHTKMLFLCSPNNPTGNLLEQSKIEQLIHRFPGVVVVDEAYIDFSEQRSFTSKVEDYPNLVVLQTFSKSFGLAGIRLGAAFASKPIIAYLMKVKAPYNINTLTSRAALDAFNHQQNVAQNIADIKALRADLRQQLAQLDRVQHIFESDANFLLVRMPHAKKIYERLTRQGIIVRYRGDEPGCSNCLRITVGTSNENETLINALKAIEI